MVIRWQLVLSKYFCPTRLRKLFTVHGASALSSLRLIVPAVVARVTFEVPFAETLPSFGGSTFFEAFSADFL